MSAGTRDNLDRKGVRGPSRWAALGARLMHAPFARQVAAMLPDRGAGVTIVDVGAGPGRLALELHRLCPEAHIVGVDPSEAAVRAGRDYAAATGYAGYDARLGAAESLPLEAGCADLLVTQSSFHEWHDHTAGLAEVYRVLRPGGVVLVKDYNRAWLAPWRRAVLGLLHHLEMFRFTPHEVARALTEARFVDVDLQGEGVQFVVQGRRP